MAPRANTGSVVVKVTRVHPFRLHLLQRGVREYAAAKELGVTREWLSAVLNDKADASEELYRDMVKFAKGAVTLKELSAFRKASQHRRRRLVEIPKRRRKKTEKRPDLAAELGSNGKPEVVH